MFQAVRSAVDEQDANASWEAAVHLATGGWGWKWPVKGEIHSDYGGGGYWKT